MSETKEMTCREFDEAVHGFVRMELLDLALRESVLEHAAQCSLCAERMAEATALAESSEAVSRITRDGQAPPRVEAALLTAFRNHHRRRAAWQRNMEWATVGAAAAVLLGLLWTAGGRPKGQLPPAPRKGVSSHSNEPLDAKGPAGVKPDVLTPAPNAEPVRASGTETYTASDFVPVPFSAGIAPDDAGMIVRVQLTRASLAELGYPVAETPEEDLISADILVGEDGWPRGVKLVP